MSDQDTELAVSGAQPPTLFGTNDPSAVVQKAADVAAVLKSVLRDKHLIVKISNKEHVTVEGWTLLGTMLGVFPEVVWTRPLDDPRGWEARVQVVTRAGEVVGAAEAMCSRAEKSWTYRDDYALRSMAQTRAISKALRVPLGFVVLLAGYQATPAEEMDWARDKESGAGDKRSRATGKGTTVSPPAPDNTVGEAAGDSGPPSASESASPLFPACPKCGSVMLSGEMAFPGGPADKIICSKCRFAVKKEA